MTSDQAVEEAHLSSAHLLEEEKFFIGPRTSWFHALHLRSSSRTTYYYDGPSLPEKSVNSSLIV